MISGLHMVARLDGRSFTRLTKEVHKFEAPFDVRFRDLMVETTEHVMGGCGFNIVYGYTDGGRRRWGRGADGGGAAGGVWIRSGT
jgi:tRNA(His) guanylyltransferase